MKGKKTELLYHLGSTAKRSHWPVKNKHLQNKKKKTVMFTTFWQCVFQIIQWIFKGEVHWFHTYILHKVFSQFLESTTAHKLYEGFCGSRGSYTKSDEVPQVMSLESASVGSEDYKFENEKNLCVELERGELLISAWG